MARTVPNPSTLEEAREMLLQHTNELNQLDETIENLNSQAAENVETIEELRTLNQKLYLRVSQGTIEEEDKKEEPSETLEEFATKNLKGMIR